MKNNVSQFVPMEVARPKSLNELLEKLGEHPGTTANAKVINEIKGIMEIYNDIDPVSAAKVMERVAVKLAGALIDTLESCFNTEDMDDETFDPLNEWENGFEAYLLFNGKTEKTIEVYIRCIRRIMKNMQITDINEMLERMDEYQCNGSNERSALTQFDKYVNDGLGYIIVLDESKTSKQYALWRGYNTLESALEELEYMREEHQALGEDPNELILFDKLGNKVNM
jgi:hypothetical protein